MEVTHERINSKCLTRDSLGHELRCCSMAERFNEGINELLRQPRFDSRADLQTTLLIYCELYNHHIPKHVIGGKPSILAFNKWQKKRPELFVKRVYD